MSKTHKIDSELRRENKQLGLVIVDLKKHNKSLTRTINSLTKSNDKLKHKLSYYDNPHTPPSRKLLQVEKDEKEKNTKPNRGGVFGHKGKTQTFIPQKTTHHDSTACPKCKSTDITQIDTKKRNMVGIPPPQEYNVTEHILHRYTCKSCKKTFKNDGKLLPRGQFDATVIKSVVSMFSKRMPYNTIRESLQEQYGLQISNTTVLSILQTGQMLLEPFYDKIGHEINKSEIVGFDGTGYPIEGKHGWAWIARTNTEAYYVLDFSRGAVVIKKYWIDFRGIVVSDGWKSHVVIFTKNKRQRCTAQLPRESKDVADKSEKPSAAILHKEFSKILDNAKKYSKSKHKKIQRIKYTDYLFEQLII